MTPRGGTLQVTAISAGYRRGPDVLDGVSFDVAPGEVLAVLGRNGAGKTTLLRAVSGLLRLRGGWVALDGHALEHAAPHRIANSGLGHVPEGRRVIQGMSVLDNLRLGAHGARSGRNMSERLDEVLALLPVLAGWRSRVAGTLSGGEQQLLAIGRALMNRPSVLMLDEPLTGLSPAMRHRVLQVLSDISATGRSMVIVEQNVVETLPHADRALVLDGGRVVLAGTAEEMLGDSAVQEAFLNIKAAPERGTQPKER